MKQQYIQTKNSNGVIYKTAKHIDIDPKDVIQKWEFEEVSPEHTMFLLEYGTKISKMILVNLIVRKKNPPFETYTLTI